MNINHSRYLIFIERINTDESCQMLALSLTLQEDLAQRSNLPQITQLLDSRVKRKPLLFFRCATQENYKLLKKNTEKLKEEGEVEREKEYLRCCHHL